MNDYELVVAGLANLLSHYRDRLEVCERLIVGDPVHTEIDVALYDTYGRAGLVAPALRTLASEPAIRYVAVFSLELSPDLITEGRAAGANAFISKSLSGEEIADAIVRVADGVGLVATTPSPGPSPEGLDWPGKEDGLTERQSQVLVLAAEGLSNREIAAALYLSVETVKDYLRQSYARLNVRNRVQAAKYVYHSAAFVRFEAREPGRHLDDDDDGGLGASETSQRRDEPRSAL